MSTAGWHSWEPSATGSQCHGSLAGAWTASQCYKQLTHIMWSLHLGTHSITNWWQSWPCIWYLPIMFVHIHIHSHLVYNLYLSCFKFLVVVQLLSHVQLFRLHGLQHARLPRSFAVFRSLLIFMSIESVVLSNHLILLTPPSPFAFNLSQHLGLFQWVGLSHQVAKVLVLKILFNSLSTVGAQRSDLTTSLLSF